MSARQASLKKLVIEVSQDYLGPTADRFVERQIAMHLHKRTSEISREDLKKLADWLKLSFALLTNSIQLVEEYGQRLELIVNGQEKEALGKEWLQE